MNIQKSSISISDLFDNPDQKSKKPFLIAPDSLSFKEAREEISLIMRLFEDRGLQKGDMIILCIENDADLVVFFLAAFRFGLVASILSVENTSVEARALIQHVEPKAVVCSTHILEHWQSQSVLEGQDLALTLGVSKRRTSTRERFRSLFASSEQDQNSAGTYPSVVAQLSPLGAPKDEPQLSDFSMLVFTSGSTGTPKVVRLKYSAVIAQAKVMSAHLGLNSDSVMLSLIPFTSLGAAASGALLSYMNGSTFVRPVRKFSNQSIPDILDTIYSKRVSHFFLSPAMMQLLLRFGENLKETFDTDDFKCFLSMSAMLPKQLWESFEENTGKEVVNSYGLSEANNLTFTGPEHVHRDTNSVGQISESHWKIVGEDGGNAEIGEIGELVVSGPTVMYDYFRSQDETEESLTDGWFRTGDLARHDGDGNIFIVGRIKDVVIVGGNNVYPEEVDDNIRLHPKVVDTCSLGVDDSIMGEIVVSCVVREDESLDEAALISHLRGRISPIKIPAKVLFVNDIPMSERGKADRLALKEQIDRTFGSSSEDESSSIEAQVISIAAETFMLESSSLEPSSNYSNTMGWDSLGHVMFVEALGDSFDIEIEPIDVLKIHTISDAVSLIEKKLSAKSA